MAIDIERGANAPSAADPARASNLHNIFFKLKRVGGAIASRPRYPSLARMRSKDVDFLAPVLAIVETPVPPLRSAMLFVICGAMTVLAGWSIVSTLDIFAVARGKVQPSGLSKVIQPLEPGRVSAIRVANGAKVTIGDVLIELDPTETEAERAAAWRDVRSTEAEIARRNAAIAWAAIHTGPVPQVNFPTTVEPAMASREQRVLAADTGQLTASLDTLQAQIKEKLAERTKLEMSTAARKRLLLILKERVDTRDKLDTQGQGYRARVIDALQEYERERTSLASDEGQLIEIAAGLRSLEQKINEATATFIADQNKALLEAERKQSRLREDLVKATSRSQRTVLKAPIAGIIQQLTVTTIGQVVTTGQILATIVPQQGPIEVEAQLQNSDVGFVEPGQIAIIKVDAFPFTRYGTITGKVTKVSSEAVDERDAATPSEVSKETASSNPASSGHLQRLVFPVTIELDQHEMRINNKDILLRPGMVITAEIKTGKRRAIDYILAPLRQLASESGHER